MNPTIKIAFTDEADQNIALPSYETAGAAGADIRANLPPTSWQEGVTIKPAARALVPTGLQMAIPQGYEIQVRPRSGLALKHGITLVNTPGTIDADYRGPVGVILINLGDTPYTVSHGERIAQLIVAPVVQGRFERAAILGETARGAGGFGSTGKS